MGEIAAEFVVVALRRKLRASAFSAVLEVGSILFDLMVW